MESKIKLFICLNSKTGKIDCYEVLMPYQISANLTKRMTAATRKQSLLDLLILGLLPILREALLAQVIVLFAAMVRDMICVPVVQNSEELE